MNEPRGPCIVYVGQCKKAYNVTTKSPSRLLNPNEAVCRVIVSSHEFSVFFSGHSSYSERKLRKKNQSVSFDKVRRSPGTLLSEKWWNYEEFLLLLLNGRYYWIFKVLKQFYTFCFVTPQWNKRNIKISLVTFLVSHAWHKIRQLFH